MCVYLKNQSVCKVSRVFKMYMLWFSQKNTCSLVYSMATQTMRASFNFSYSLVKDFSRNWKRSLCKNERTWRAKQTNASELMLITCCYQIQTERCDRLGSEKQFGFSDGKWQSTTGNSFKAAAFPQKGRSHSRRCDIPSLPAIMVPCLKMTGVRMRPPLLLSTPNRGHSLCFVFSVIAPFTKCRRN